MTEQAFPLSPLRQELRIDPGAPLPSGAPGFILFDPLRHLFFQLGALEQRVAAHWGRGEAHAVRDALVAEGEDPDAAEDAIVAFHEFVDTNSLTRTPVGDAVATLTARDAARRRDWWRWLLDHYLFVRIPLVRPAAFLARTLPYARLIWSPAGITVLGAMALLGMLLVSRQFDAFTGTFGDLLTARGLAAYAGALLFVKAFHELGHAYVATRYGCRVPSMGVSLLVMVPVLYTDTSAAWRLRSRKQRMMIDAAGILAELSVAAVALLAWSFLPDGMLRTGAFVLATTSLAASLLVNASPFMRFDGYYILSDLLGVPNLAPRSFALARWKLRELLFALGEAPPEELSAPLRRTMLAYAVVTIAYRTALYVGIALLVYHSVFKALGIILFIVEVYVFLARPIVAELKEWQARHPAIAASRRARIVAGIALAAVAAAFLPLDRSVSLPAMLTPMDDTPLVVAEPARVERLLVRAGDTVTAGQPLATLASPDLVLGAAQARLRIAQIESQIARGASDRQDLADFSVLQRDLAAEHERLRGIERRQAALTFTAPTAGRVVDLPSGVGTGSWIAANTTLLRVIAPSRFAATAYASEDERWRVDAGATGRFVPDNAAAASWQVRLDEVGASPVRTLAHAALSQENGGAIATTSKDRLKPTHAIVALRLVAQQSASDALPQPVAGRVVLPARGESIAAIVWRGLGRVLVRETSLS